MVQLVDEFGKCLKTLKIRTTLIVFLDQTGVWGVGLSDKAATGKGKLFQTGSSWIRINFNFLQYHCRCHEKQIVDVTKSMILDVTKSMIIDVKKSMISDVTKSMTVDVTKSMTFDVNKSIY